MYKRIINVNHKGEFVPCQVEESLSVYRFTGKNLHKIEMEMVRKYMKHFNYDVVTQSNNHFLFCTIIEECEVINEEITKLIAYEVK